MLDQTEKRTGYKFGDGYKFIRKRVQERKSKRLARKGKKSEVSPETVESVEVPEEDGEEESEEVENYAVNDDDDD